jgi:chromosome segregation ATPase
MTYTTPLGPTGGPPPPLETQVELLQAELGAVRVQCGVLMTSLLAAQAYTLRVRTAWDSARRGRRKARTERDDLRTRLNHSVEEGVGQERELDELDEALDKLRTERDDARTEAAKLRAADPQVVRLERERQQYEAAIASWESGAIAPHDALTAIRDQLRGRADGTETG